MKKRYYVAALALVACSACYLTFRTKNRPLLITGCARSGTTYISKVLLQGGFEVGHERMMSDGVSSWYLAAAPAKTKRRVNFKRFHFDHIFTRSAIL